MISKSVRVEGGYLQPVHRSKRGRKPSSKHFARLVFTGESGARFLALQHVEGLVRGESVRARPSFFHSR
jgi:hypothetical protein